MNYPYCLKTGFIIVITALLSGCTTVFLSPRVRQYNIAVNVPTHWLDSNHSAKNTSKVSVLVTPAIADEPYNSKSMYYRIQNARPLGYQNSLWLNNPPKMLTDYLATILPFQGLFKHVIPPRTIGFADYLLIGHLHDLSQTLQKNKTTTNLSITYHLVSTKTGDEIGKKRFDLTEKSIKTPQFFEQSANNLTERLMLSIKIWLSKKLPLQRSK